MRHSDHDYWPRRRRLATDPATGKVGGVCAGLARYFDRQTVFFRIGAVAGLFLAPTMTLTAYLIAWFLLDKVPSRRRRW